MIKVAGLIHKRPNQSNPRLASLILQNIYLMNSDVNNKEEINYAMLLTSMSEIYKPTKNKTNVKTHGIMCTTTIPCYEI